MDEERLLKGGFYPVRENQALITGGIDGQTISRLFNILCLIAEVVSSYGDNFMKGYKKGLEGKPLWK